MVRKAKIKDNEVNNDKRIALCNLIFLGNIGNIRKKPWVFLIFPILFFLFIFFLYPIFLIFAVSLCKYVSPSIVKELTLENYFRFLRSGFFLSKVLLITFKLAIISTFFALLIGYPFAYFLSRMKNLQVRRFLMVSVILVLWVNEVIRVHGWMIILLDHGILNRFLMKIGFINNPIHLIYNEGGVLVALVQISIPYIVISLLGVLSYIDPSLEEVAQTLGANKLTTFLRITIPLSIPGILAGTLLVFALNVNAFSIPLLMGGGKVSMLGVEIYKYAMEINNLPFASAMSVLLLMFTLTVIGIYNNLLNKLYRGV
jgi:putative spermidine/putrescine transport system permease protein